MKTQRRSRVQLCVEILEDRLALSALAVSSNWAGYAVQSDLRAPESSVSKVKGSWVVPEVSGQGTAFAAVWVGIDGYTSRTVQQIGTGSDLINGVAVYSVWYEVYPKPSVTVSSVTIRPGDTVSAQVSYSSGLFQLEISNQSSGESFKIEEASPAAERSSAEWIVEAPASDNGALPLADFGTVTFTEATATIEGEAGPIESSATEAVAITMAAPGGNEATTSTVTGDGETSSFSVTFAGSQDGDASPQQPRLFRGPNLAIFSSIGFTAVPPTATLTRILTETLTTNPVVGPAPRIPFTPTTSTASSWATASRLSYAGVAYEIAVLGDEPARNAVTPAKPGAANPSGAERAPAQPMNQQAPPATPNTPPPATEPGRDLPDEMAISLLFAEPDAANDVVESSVGETWSPARLAALASVLLFLATPRITIPERRQRVALSA